MKKMIFFFTLTHDWTNFPTVTCQNRENQVSGVLRKNLTIIFKPTFIVLMLRWHTCYYLLGSLLLCLKASLIFVFPILAIEKLKTVANIPVYILGEECAGVELHSHGWFGKRSLLVVCPKPGFKHKCINFIYSLHCLEHFSRRVNYGPDLQLVVNLHSPLTSE